MEDLGCSLSKRKTDTVLDEDVSTQREGNKNRHYHVSITYLRFKI